MITSLRLQNFRSYKDSAFEFGPGVNIIVGPNGSGKTNLLEGLLVIARGSSYRAKDPELITHHKNWARLDATTPTNHRIVKLTAQPTVAKQYEIDGHVYKRLSPTKTIPLVLFEPDHLLLLSGPPELRRVYLDDLLEQTLASFRLTRMHYRRALTQRNNLLKKRGIAAREQIFPWDVRLSELGDQIVQQRSRLVDQLQTQASDVYSKLAHHKTKIELHYETGLPLHNYASAFLHYLQQSFEIDCARGFTARGPHRDDLELKINGQSAQATASRGELRTAVLMLKVAELRLAETLSGQVPILLLDDVFSELDGGRRRALTRFLKNYQTFITTTDADVVVQHFTQTCNIIPLNGN